MTALSAQYVTLHRRGAADKHPPCADTVDSGSIFIGRIPAHWSTRRLKLILREPLQYGANEAADTDDPNQPRFIRITDIADDGTLREDTFRSLPEEIARPYLLRDGDVLLARSGATVGKSFFYRPTWGRAAYAGYLIRARLDLSKATPRFLHFFAQSDAYWQWVQSIFIQSTIQNVSAEKYANLVVPIPPLDEQRAVTTFLDRETAKIDELIAKKRRTIECLCEKRQALVGRTVTKGLNPNVPMKPSGIDWIGDVPQHWGIQRLRFLFTNLNHRRIPLSGEERSYRAKIYPYYGASGIIDAVDDYIFDEPLILVAEDGANLLSRSTPLAFLAEGKYWVNNHAHIIRPRFGPIRYWEAVLQTFDFTPLVSGSAQPKLTIGNLNNVVLPVPPIEEQQAIMTALVKETDKLHAVTDAIGNAVARLSEYRSALITVAVTGQIDVRNYRPEAL